MKTRIAGDKNPGRRDRRSGIFNQILNLDLFSVGLLFFFWRHDGTEGSQAAGGNRRILEHRIDHHQRVAQAGKVSLTTALAVLRICDHGFTRVIVEIEHIHRAAIDAVHTADAGIYVSSCNTHFLILSGDYALSVEMPIASASPGNNRT